MDGVFLSPSEDEFVGRITEELEHFMLQGQHHRVLLFPPLSSRLRYLIHRTVENVDLLSSFSVGEGWRRRTVICHSAVRLPSETKPSEAKPSSNPSRLHRPAQPWGRGGRGGRQRHAGDVQGDGSRACVGSGRIQRPPRRKPDKALYLPKAMRRKGEQESPGAAAAEPGGSRAQGGEGCPEASVGAGQEEPGKPGGSPRGVSSARGEQQEPAEERVAGGKDGGEAEHPPRGVESGGDACGRESQAEDCSGALPSAPKRSPAEAEEQDWSCDGAARAEGGEAPCQLRAAERPRREAGAGQRGEPSGPSDRAGRSGCAGPAGAEASAAAWLPLEDQEEGCAAARSRERGGSVSLPEEQAEDSPSAGTEREGGSSELQSQGREGPGDVRLEPEQNPPEAPHEPQAVPEPDPPAAEEQKEAWVDAPGQNPGGQVPVAEEEGKEGPGLWDELHLSAGDKEESRGGPGQSSPEDDCTAELLAEIVNYLSVKDISIEKISFDYSTYGEAQLTQGDFGHVTEIYDFSPAMKTEQLLEVFSDFHESGFKIQWVDDTHALGIFSSLSTASQALGRRYPALKIRPLLHATKQSKTKALQRPKLLHLAKERPQTDTVVAKRLVSRALGLKNKHQAEGGSGPEGLLPESLEQEE